MASCRLFFASSSHSFFHFHPLSHSFATLSSSFSLSTSHSSLFKPRVSLQLGKLPSFRLVQNGVTLRAYMSSLSAAETSQKSESSKAYGSDQIQEKAAARPPKLQVIKAKARARSSSTPTASAPVTISAETIKGTSSATAKKLANFMTFVPTPSFKYPRKNDKLH